MGVVAKLIANKTKERLLASIKKVTGLEQVWRRKGGIRDKYMAYQASRWLSANWGQWEELPLSPEYQARKSRDHRAKEGGRMQMVLYGRLLKSILGKSGDYREVSTPRQIVVRTAVPYAPYLDHFSSGAPRYKFMGDFDDKFRDSVKQIIKRQVRV